MKKFIFISLFVALIIIFGWGFSVTRAQEVPKPKANVLDVSGSAEVKKANSGNWEKVEAGMEVVKGDEFKTGDDGQIFINIFDQSSSRIGPNTEMVFNNLSIDESDYAKTNVNINVIVGRIWSRIIQLSDRSSSFEIESSSVVATVRGTIVDFEVDAMGRPTVNNPEGIIKVSKLAEEEITDESGGGIKIKKGEDDIYLTEGNSVTLEKDEEGNDLLIIEEMTSEIKDSDWFRENEILDKEFIDNLKKKQEEICEKMAGAILPGDKMYNLKKTAEKIRILLTRDKNKKKELVAAFADRRLAEAYQLAAMGRIAIAEQIVDSFKAERDEVVKSDGVDLNFVENKINNQINFQKSLINSDPSNRLKHNLVIKIEKVEDEIGGDKKDQAFAQFRRIKDRLRLMRVFKKEGNEELYKKYLSENEELIKKLESIGDETDLINYIRMEMEIIDKLKKAGEENASDDSLETDLSTQEASTTEATSTEESISRENSDLTEDGSMTIDQEIQKVVEQELLEAKEKVIEQQSPTADISNVVTQPVETVQLKKLDKMIIFSDNKRYNMVAGDKKQFMATVYYSNGESKDITSEAWWKIDGDIGQIGQTGLLQADQDGGKGFISADFMEDGITVSAKSPEVTALTTMP